ncbi:MAG: PP2C family serine/threonine-protein phosphatase [Gemmatimonadales bacterium]
MTDTLTNPPRKPRDDEIDVFGLTHPGKVRATNQDHFLLGAIHRRLQVLHTSLTDQERLPFADDRIAFIAMVADGVGSGAGGGEASKLALEIATHYVLGSIHSYQSSEDGMTFENALQEAAMVSHEGVMAAHKSDPDIRSMATTLTLWFGVWPWYYLLQVGDSRYYLFRDNVLTQVTRDQTMAQDLVDQGVLKRADADRSRLANVLSSAIGGPTTVPVVTRLRADWKNVHLICSDGLTKHVSDEKIAERLRSMTTSKQVCEQLLQDVLDDGGSDNVTIIVGRSTPKAVA